MSLAETPRSGPALPGPREPLNVVAIYREHAQTVARWAGRLAGPSIDVEDVVQEVFLVVHRRLHTFRGEAKLTTWLYRITDNVVRHRRRKERMRRWLGGSAEETAALEASSWPTPVEELERRQASRTVYRILDAMPDKYRQVLILFEIEGLSGEEISDLTGTRLATVWVHLHRARDRFLKDLVRLELRGQA